MRRVAPGPLTHACRASCREKGIHFFEFVAGAKARERAAKNHKGSLTEA
jgi:hypothetical protein